MKIKIILYFCLCFCMGMPTNSFSMRKKKQTSTQRMQDSIGSFVIYMNVSLVDGFPEIYFKNYFYPSIKDHVPNLAFNHVREVFLAYFNWKRNFIISRIKNNAAFNNFYKAIQKDLLGLDEEKVKDIFTRLKNEDFNKDLSLLYWCNCSKAPEDKRFYAILHLLNRLVGQGLHKKDEICYLSFGAGSLLQDYIPLRVMAQLGVKKVTVIPIDLEYTDIAGKRFVKFQAPTLVGPGGTKLYSCEALKATKDLLDGKNTKSETVFDFWPYDTYYKFLSEWGDKKVDILVMADPGMKWHTVKYDSNEDINYIRFISFDNFFVHIFLPQQGRPIIFYRLLFGVMELPELLKKTMIELPYSGFKDKDSFISDLDKTVDKILKKEYKFLNFVYIKHQSPLFAFAQIFESVASKNALIYQIDKNSVFIGPINLVFEALEKEEYEKLKF